jgi:hypothetical protein
MPDYILPEAMYERVFAYLHTNHRLLAWDMRASAKQQPTQEEIENEEAEMNLKVHIALYGEDDPGLYQTEEERFERGETWEPVAEPYCEPGSEEDYQDRWRM